MRRNQCEGRARAPRLDEAGHSARQIADHLGHSHPSLTQDVYLGRGTASPRTAPVIRRAL
jgi:integrase